MAGAGCQRGLPHVPALAVAMATARGLQSKKNGGSRADVRACAARAGVSLRVSTWPRRQGQRDPRGAAAELGVPVPSPRPTQELPNSRPCTPVSPALLGGRKIRSSRPTWSPRGLVKKLKIDHRHRNGSHNFGSSSPHPQPLPQRLLPRVSPPSSSPLPLVPTIFPKSPHPLPITPSTPPCPHPGP